MDMGRSGWRVSAKVMEKHTASNVRIVFRCSVAYHRTYHKAAISGDEGVLTKFRTDPSIQVYETS